MCNAISPLTPRAPSHMHRVREGGVERGAPPRVCVCVCAGLGGRQGVQPALMRAPPPAPPCRRCRCCWRCRPPPQTRWPAPGLQSAPSVRPAEWRRMQRAPTTQSAGPARRGCRLGVRVSEEGGGGAVGGQGVNSRWLGLGGGGGQPPPRLPFAHAHARAQTHVLCMKAHQQTLSREPCETDLRRPIAKSGQGLAVGDGPL